MSTGPSNAVDISHEKELKKGLTTSGEKSDYNERQATTTQKIAGKVEEMADKVNKVNAQDKNQAAMMDQANTSRVKYENATSGYPTTGSNKPGGSQNIQPGTEHLKGLNDNFNDDPAISLGEIKDKAKDTKNSVKEGVKSVLPNAVVDGPGQMLEHAAKSVKAAVKATPLHDIGHSMKVKVKEMVTGEREKEKPDEDKSEVRTKGWEQRQRQQSGGR